MIAINDASASRHHPSLRSSCSSSLDPSSCGAVHARSLSDTSLASLSLVNTAARPSVC